jgi:predicted secreted hydrolase
MRNSGAVRILFRLLSLLCVVGAAQQAGQLALPGYQYEFPRDHFSHPEYDTEWWYFTGNVKAADGHEFGFEVTFFRAHPDEQNHDSVRNPVWNADQIYIAHFALSDITAGKFYHQERLNRPGPGIAGVDASQRIIWNGNWQVRWLSFDPIEQELEAVDQDTQIRLKLKSRKPIVINGRNGVSQKGQLRGEASHYYSLTRIAASGNLAVHGKKYEVAGLAWMDREFFSNVQGSRTQGWDWMCIQLDTNEDLMLYRLRLKDGSISPYSSGTFVDAQGKAEFLDNSKFSLDPLRTWHSPISSSDYPIEWNISIPSKSLALHLTTPLPQQELDNRVTESYWEGAVRYNGTEAGKKTGGIGYLEMTGYDRSRPRSSGR